jgi:hypothetical protein
MNESLITLDRYNLVKKRWWKWKPILKKKINIGKQWGK